MANKHFTTNRVSTERTELERLQRMTERVAMEAQTELLRRVQVIKSNLDRKAGR